MSSKYSLPKIRDEKRSKRLPPSKSRALWQASGASIQPKFNRLPSECYSEEFFQTAQCGKHVFRQRSATIYLPGASRIGLSIEALNNRGRFIENLKFPSLRQRVKLDSTVEIGVVEGSIPVQRRLSCVLPDFSGRKEEPNFGVAPLRQQDVEKWNDNFDPVDSTSHNLAKWLRDQTWWQRGYRSHDSGGASTKTWLLSAGCINNLF